MIDAKAILLSPVPITVAEAARVTDEMGDALNSIQVQLRERVDLGDASTPGTLGFRLLQAWNHLYWANALLTKLEQDAANAPIWTGDEPPLDEMPSPV